MGFVDSLKWQGEYLITILYPQQKATTNDHGNWGPFREA